MSRARRLRLAALSGLIGVLALVGPAALAQTTGGEDDTPFLAVRTVDSVDAQDTVVGLTWTGDESALSGLEVAENGEQVAVGDPVPFDGPRGVVIVVDSSAAMETAMASVKDAVASFAGGLPAGTQMALVSYGDTAEMVRDFTTDPAAIADGVDGLAPKGAAAMWDGVYTAAQALEEQPTLQPNMVVISAVPDSASSTPVSRVSGLTTSLGTSVFAVGIEPNAPAAPLQQLVSTSGGRYLSTTDVDQTLTSDVTPSIADQYDVTFASGVEDGATVDLDAHLGDLEVSVSYVDGAVVSGNLALAPLPVTGGGGGGLLHSGLAKFLAVALVLLAASLGAYALILVFTKDEDGLSAVLEVYSEGYGTESDADEDDGRGATTALIQRAVDLTEEIADRQGFLAKTEGSLERAALPLRAAEALFFYGALTLTAFVILFLLTGNVMATLIIGGVLAAIPPVFVSYKAKKRQKAFLAQLPDTLALLAGTLRAGYSLMQGVEAVSQEVDEPMGSELRRVVTESRLGRPLEESLEASAQRMNSPDFSWAVMAIRIQREVGGNLAELLLTVGDTMTQRERLRRDVAALTAEGKVSAIVLGLLPIGLGAAMFVINPEYISALFTSKAGNFLLGGAVLLALVGFYWMKKTIEIEI